MTKFHNHRKILVTSIIKNYKMRGGFKQDRYLVWIQFPQNYVSLFPFLSVLFAFSFFFFSGRLSYVGRNWLACFSSTQEHQEERNSLRASIAVPKLMLTPLLELYAHPWTKCRIQGYSLSLLALPTRWVGNLLINDSCIWGQYWYDSKLVVYSKKGERITNSLCCTLETNTTL